MNTETKYYRVKNAVLAGSKVNTALKKYNMTYATWQYWKSKDEKNTANARTAGRNEVPAHQVDNIANLTTEYSQLKDNYNSLKNEYVSVRTGYDKVIEEYRTLRDLYLDTVINARKRSTVASATRTVNNT